MEHEHKLVSTAQELLSGDRGLLAADESFGTIGKRFANINVESTPEKRSSYREMLFATENLKRYISGVILFDETLRQQAQNGIAFASLLKERGMVPGIKVDKGAKPLAAFADEKVTEGLDGLRERLSEYRQLGARFTKWRAVIKIDHNQPTPFCIYTNASSLARYAALSQEAGMVPVVEPEVLMDGHHGIEVCEEVTTATLKSVFEQLHKHRVLLEGIVLKPNMVVPGKDSVQKADVQQVAQATLRALRRSVPAAVPGIAFLSGGQSPLEATENLNAINKMKNGSPWVLTFSFSRALQGPVLDVWKGKGENALEAQKILLHRAHCNSSARKGTYSGQLESSLH